MKLIIFLTLFFLSCIGYTNDYITGSVVDISNNPIAGARIDLAINGDHEKPISVRVESARNTEYSDDYGIYAFDLGEWLMISGPGNNLYSFKVYKAGYKVLYDEITKINDTIVEKNFILQLE